MEPEVPEYLNYIVNFIGILGSVAVGASLANYLARRSSITADETGLYALHQVDDRQDAYQKIKDAFSTNDGPSLAVSYFDRKGRLVKIFQTEEGDGKLKNVKRMSDDVRYVTYANGSFLQLQIYQDKFTDTETLTRPETVEGMLIHKYLTSH